MEQYGNTSTYNMEQVLRQNIINGEYFRDTCSKFSTVEEVVDEIYYKVTDVEPWMSGNARGASTAFCLLFRLFTLVPTEKEVHFLLEHQDSPYIRAIGFLYLRYIGNPKQHWDWIRKYVRDEEEIVPSPNGKAVTMGAYVRDVFLEQYYFETIFPRIPKPVQDDFIAKLSAGGLPSKALGNAGQGGPDRRGIEDANRRPASVKASLSVAFGQRAPNRAAGREEGRGLGAGMKGGVASERSPARAAHKELPSPARPVEVDRERHSSRDRPPADRQPGRDRSRDYRDRDMDRDSRREHHDRDSHRDRDRDSYHGSRRELERSREGERERDRRRSRSRSADRKRGGGGGGRDARDVFRESGRR